MSALGTVSNVSQSARSSVVLLVDVAFAFVTGALILLPASIVAVAVVLKFRPDWAPWRAGLTAALFVMLVIGILAAILFA